jgi:hypothetical protein
VDRSDGGLDALIGHQPGTATPLARRRTAFEALLRPLCRGGEGVPLCEVIP